MKSQHSVGFCPTQSPEFPAGSSLTEHLERCLEAQRQAAAHLIRDLRHLAREQSNLALSGDRTYSQQLTQIDRAYELWRQAEAKLEILISRIGRGR